jgi:cytoplasmic iron level regulating protein YaaA (DUF328/UPF0246 family)
MYEEDATSLSLDELTQLAVVYSAAMGKLILMKELNAFDDFWRDDIQEIINKSIEMTPTVLEILRVSEVITSIDEGQSQTKH